MDRCVECDDSYIDGEWREAKTLELMGTSVRWIICPLCKKKKKKNKENDTKRGIL